ncbi:hypothetical protein, partial [Burkholderia anthina]|uniref:hypothetical protein n=1 Tax=Burkholderia anthina TaxID=179879 RepID=UPI001ABA080A
MFRQQAPRGFATPPECPISSSIRPRPLAGSVPAPWPSRPLFMSDPIFDPDAGHAALRIFDSVRALAFI